MAVCDNSYLTEDENDHQLVSCKRIITVSSDEEDDQMNNSNNNKRQCSSSLQTIKPLKLMNKQPIIRSTTQTSLSIIRTSSNNTGNEERKWNLKTIATSSNESSSVQKKKRMSQTVNTNRRGKYVDIFN